MSDDERDVDVDAAAGAGGGEATAVDTGLDEQGYHVVSNRGKFQAQMNPLQLKLQEEKRKAEEKRKEAEKKAKLAEKLKAFGGGKDEHKDDGKDGDNGSKPKMAVPEVQKGPLDSRMKEMMSAGIVSSTMGKPGGGRGAALLSSRGRGGKAAGRGRGGPAGGGAGDGGGSAAGASAGGGGGSGSSTTTGSDDSSDDDRPKKKAAAQAANATRMSMSRRSARMSLRDLGSMIGSALGLGGAHAAAASPTVASPGASGAAHGSSASEGSHSDGSSGGSASGPSPVTPVQPARQPSSSTLGRLARASLTALGLAAALGNSSSSVGSASSHTSPSGGTFGHSNSEASGGSNSNPHRRESMSNNAPLSPAMIEQGRQRAMELVANAQVQRAASQRLAASSVSSSSSSTERDLTPAKPQQQQLPPVSSSVANAPQPESGSGDATTHAEGVAVAREARASAVDENGCLNIRAIAASGKVKRWDEVWTTTSSEDGDGGEAGASLVTEGERAASLSSSTVAVIAYPKLRALVQEASLAAAKRLAVASSASSSPDASAPSDAGAEGLQLSPQLLAAGVRSIEVLASTPELHLSDADLGRYLEVSGGRREWDSLPKWKQQSLRKKAKLAVNIQALAMTQQQAQN